MGDKLSFSDSIESFNAVREFLGTSSFGNRLCKVKICFNTKDIPICFDEELEIESSDGLFKIYCQSFGGFKIRNPLWTSYNKFEINAKDKTLRVTLGTTSIEFLKK